MLESFFSSTEGLFVQTNIFKGRSRRQGRSLSLPVTNRKRCMLFSRKSKTTPLIITTTTPFQFFA